MIHFRSCSRRPRLPRAVLTLLVAVVLVGCSHDTKVMLQEHQIGPQFNFARTRILRDELRAIPPGTTQEEILEKYGVPVMVHVDGREPCAPWNSCKYLASFFLYNTKENYTCEIYFALGVVDKPTVCAPFLNIPILGPGDINPRTGMTANPPLE